jgi:hypothetical protein
MWSATLKCNIYYTRGLYKHSVRAYIAGVVKYCEKPENQHLRKKLGGSF